MNKETYLIFLKQIKKDIHNWILELYKNNEIKIIKNKEIGHSYSAIMENKIITILQKKWYNVIEPSKKRDMDDLILKYWDEEIHANVNFWINVKWNPNMVSMNRILDFYYQNINKKYIIIKIYIENKHLFVDIFDFLDNASFYSFNMWTWQIMLKEIDYLKLKDNIEWKQNYFLDNLKKNLSYLENKYLKTKNIEYWQKYNLLIQKFNSLNTPEKKFFFYIYLLFIIWSIKHIELKEKQLKNNFNNYLNF